MKGTGISHHRDWVIPKFNMFSSVLWVFGVILNLRSKGGGQKIFNASLRGWGNFQCVAKGGGEKFLTFDFLESLGKIKGHVKIFLHIKVIHEIDEDFRSMPPPARNNKATLISTP